MSLPQLAIVQAFVLKLVVAMSIISLLKRVATQQEANSSVSVTVAHRGLSDAIGAPDEYVESIKKKHRRKSH